jgi:hypothetical protein
VRGGACMRAKARARACGQRGPGECAHSLAESQGRTRACACALVDSWCGCGRGVRAARSHARFGACARVRVRVHERRLRARMHPRAHGPRARARARARASALALHARAHTHTHNVTHSPARRACAPRQGARPGACAHVDTWPARRAHVDTWPARCAHVDTWPARCAAHCARLIGIGHWHYTGTHDARRPPRELACTLARLRETRPGARRARRAPGGEGPAPHPADPARGAGPPFRPTSLLPAPRPPEARVGTPRERLGHRGGRPRRAGQASPPVPARPSPGAAGGPRQPSR